MLDERQHAGEEHLDAGSVARFDNRMPFDPTEEVDRLLALGLDDGDTVIDFGAGTGVFALAVADHCHRVVAVDVSEPMLAHLREQIEEHGIQNVDPVNKGMVRYEHRDEPASVVFTKNALHHLPDFWKGEALKTMGRSLEEGGILRVCDFVLSFDPHDSHEAIESWIETQRRSTPFSAEEINVHFREECSTYGFLLESMLEAVGFEIQEATYDGDFYAAYTCRWRPDG